MAACPPAGDGKADLGVHVARLFALAFGKPFTRIRTKGFLVSASAFATSLTSRPLPRRRLFLQPWPQLLAEHRALAGVSVFLRPQNSIIRNGRLRDFVGNCGGFCLFWLGCGRRVSLQTVLKNEPMLFFHASGVPDIRHSGLCGSAAHRAQAQRIIIAAR
jgi:hypothetical protein